MRPFQFKNLVQLNTEYHIQIVEITESAKVLEMKTVKEVLSGLNSFKYCVYEN